MTLAVAVTGMHLDLSERGLCLVRKVHPYFMNASGIILRSPIQNHIPLVEPLKHLHETCPFSTVVQHLPAGCGHELPQIRMDGSIHIVLIARVESNETQNSVRLPKRITHRIVTDRPIALIVGKHNDMPVGPWAPLMLEIKHGVQQSCI